MNEKKTCKYRYGIKIVNERISGSKGHACHVRMAMDDLLNAASQDGYEMQSETERSDAFRRKGKKMYRILIVDDEKIERNGIAFLLRQMKGEFEVSEAANGRQALDYLQKEDVDILLTDIRMPFMDGIELISKISEQKGGKSPLKIMIFSGYNEFDYAKSAVHYGVSEYILKPVDPEEFQASMKRVLREIDAIRADSLLKERSLSFMKEHLLYELLNGVTEEELVRMSSGLVDIQAFHAYRRMMLLEMNEEFFGVAGDAFEKELKSILPDTYQYLNLNLTQSVLLFPEQNHLIDWRSLAQQIYEKIKEVFGKECYIGVSGEIKDGTQISSVLDELERMVEYKFCQPETHIYSQINRQNPLMSAEEDDAMLKWIRQDLENKNIRAVREHFQKLCQKYRSLSQFSQIYMKFLFSNILKLLYDHTQGITEKELNESMEALYRATDLYKPMEIAEAMIERTAEEFAKSSGTVRREMETVKRYIHNHYSEDLSVDLMAEQVYMAPSYLSALFKKETGENISKYIKNYRMKKAKELLEDTHEKIVNVSVAVGYPNVSYFCQSFREYFGVSPQKFRSKGGKNEAVLERTE